MTIFEVGITYCDGYSLVHDYEGADAVRLATSEYARMLEEALEPKDLPKHVRMVTLIGFDELNQPIHHVHSGIFSCSHQEKLPADIPRPRRGSD